MKRTQKDRGFGYKKALDYPKIDSTKYIVVDTWNGEGYSSNNGAEIRIFDNKEQASYHCRVEAYKEKIEDVMKVEKVENGLSLIHI